MEGAEQAAHLCGIIHKISMMQQFNQIRPVYWLLAGILTLTVAHLTWSTDAAGWIASVPFLMYLNATSGTKSRSLFFLALVVAWSFATLKIVSPPLPLPFIFFYSIPLALFHLPGYLLWARFQNRPWAVLLFPAAMTVLEWIQYTFTPFASWGVAAYTQSHSLALMQGVSIFGLPGLSFMVYWINAAIAASAIQRKITWPTFYVPVLVLAGWLVFGSLRFDISKSKGRETMLVAAIGTDSEVSGLPLPAEAENKAVQAALFQRTRKAAQSGAKLIVWNEAATFVLPEKEAAWRDTLAALAADLHTTLVAGYVVPVRMEPLLYENKCLLLDTTGKVLYTYNKHQPVPGEPAINGQEPLQVFDVAGAKTGAAICYDYDFPYLAKGYGQLNADIVAVPSSDWRGIDPIHTRMAAFRAVEQGHAILRSTRFGLSAAISPFGEFAAQMSSFDQNDKIMLANLPSRRVETVYAAIGDVLVYACIGFVLLFMGRSRKTIDSGIF